MVSVEMKGKRTHNKFYSKKGYRGRRNLREFAGGTKKPRIYPVKTYYRPMDGDA